MTVQTVGPASIEVPESAIAEHPFLQNSVTKHNKIKDTSIVY